MRITRRSIQLALGVLWLLDGALQLQPFMFTRGFATKVIAPTAQGQPAFVSVPVHWSSGLILGHHVLIDALFAAVQLAIGAGLLLRPTARAALAASIAWAMGVWYLGEGLGGIASGHASLLTGAPGAVILYAVLAAAAWPAWPETAAGAVRGRRQAVLHLAGAERSDLPVRAWLVVAWAVLWVGGAVLRALPPQDGARALAATVAGNAQGAPSWLAGWDHAVAGWVASTGGGVVVGLVVLLAVIGVMALVPGLPRMLAAGAGIGLALADWVIGQGMGQIFTGSATDPNAGLLFAVLGVAILASGRGLREPSRPRLRYLASGHEDALARRAA
ncbi:MAG: hypothetical protein ACRD0L_03710 [Acidimicrobiales bacterium]